MTKAKFIDPEDNKIKWSEIRDYDDMVKKIGHENLYDCTPDDFNDIYETPIREDIIDAYGIFKNAEDTIQAMKDEDEEVYYDEIAEFLGIEEEEAINMERVYLDAKFWQPYTRGIVLICGEEGAGKDVMAHSLAYRFREYYGKLPILEAKPKPAFGEYLPYSQDFLLDQLERINEMVDANSTALSQSNTSKEWWSDRGKIFLKWSVMVFSEFSNVMHRMTQSNPISRVMASIAKQWRHLEYSMICCDADERSIDPNYFMPRITCRVVAVQNMKDNVFTYHLYPLKYNTSKKALNVAGARQDVFLIGNEGHPGLNGHRPYDIYHSKNAQKINIPKSLLKGRK